VTTRATTATATATATQQAYGTFTNPVLYEDFADNDVFLGPDGAYYYSASNMHYSPGAPILRSHDLVNWEFVGHSVPSLAFGDHYNMTGGTAYVEGTWASTLRYRKSTGLWYWYGCIDFWNSFVYTAPAVTGPWTQSAAFYATCFYDCGLFIDDDDIMYIVYGSNTVHVAQLSSDGFSIAQTQEVFSTPSQFGGIEGNRMYKRNGIYYILDDAPGDGATLIWKSSSPWGPWTEKTMAQNLAGPLPPGGSPIQGSLVETPAGDWYFMSFEWTYPSGRLPVLAPITWGADDYPVITTVNGAWGATYPAPLAIQSTPSWIGTDNFTGTSLGVAWEWNHNPDPAYFHVNNGLTLAAATVTNDLYKARNTLTHRVHGPLAIATVVLNTRAMADGDVCGFAAFRDATTYIGIARNGSTLTISNVQGALQDPTNGWATTTTGTTVASASLPLGSTVWLRGTMQAAGSSAHGAWFEYSTDGHVFTALGGSYTLNQDFRYFIGYRWAIFNFATKALGGSISVSSFTQE
jgi:beta-xylosidase